MLIAGPELHELIDAGVIDALHENVGASSIDVRIGPETWLENRMGGVANLAAKDPLSMTRHEGTVRLQPGQFILAHTVETFNLPDDISCEFKLRSSCARAGLNHALAGWADAGFHGAQLTLELKNQTQHHTLVIEPGQRIGQMIFYRHAHAGANSYRHRGRYNGQRGATQSRGAQ